MSKQSDAIRDYIRANRIKQVEIANLLGLSQGTVSNILSGRYSLSRENCVALADKYGFNLTFLITGVGELLPQTKKGEENDAMEIYNDTMKQHSEIIRLRAENTQLRNECEWLRSMVQGLSLATQN